MSVIKLDLEIDVDVSFCKEGIEVLIFDECSDVVGEHTVLWEDLENHPFEMESLPLVYKDVLVQTKNNSAVDEINDLICKMEDSARRMRKRLEEASVFFRDDWVKDNEVSEAPITEEFYENEKYTKPFSYDMVNKND